MALGGPFTHLTEESLKKLEDDKECVSSFKREKLEREAKKNWDLFYKRNTTHFFKDRHWICREFPELERALSEPTKPVLLEAGCGVGNAIIPIIQETKNVFVYACDFSPVAIQHLKTNPLYDESYCKAFECDLTRDELTLTIPSMSVDFVLLIFVLSAINPDKMATVVSNIHKVLKTGGLVFFRDYGRYDHAMLRFSKGHKISDNFYFRQDGTRGYYFSEDEVYNIFNSNGYEVVENEYIERETVNHKEAIVAKRIFIQGKFRKTYKN